MPNILKKLTVTERKAYIASLFYILNLNGNPKKNMEYIMSRIADLGLDESALSKIPQAKSAEEMYKLIAKVKNIRTKRYILREMILVAISNHELSDAEIASIYNIGRHAGIKDEKINDFFLWAAKGLEWEIEGIQLIEGDL